MAGCYRKYSNREMANGERAPGVQGVVCLKCTGDMDGKVCTEI